MTLLKTTCAATAAVIALAFAGVAAAETKAPLYAKMEQHFTTAKPGTWTGWHFEGGLKPFAPGVQVPAQRGARFVFPRGSRFDLSAVRSCDASAEELVAGGVGSCPKSSEIMSGDASLFLGSAGILAVEAHAYVARPGLMVAFATETGVVLRAFRAAVRRNRIEVTLPAVQLGGGYEVSVTGMSLEVSRFGTRRHPGLRTPPKCPKSGRWTFVYLPRYDEPHGVQRSTSSVRCRRER
jgi:hypothetical protein